MSSPPSLWTLKTPCTVEIPTDSQETPKPERDLWAILLDEQLDEDKERCQGWKDEIQNLLTFTGLFSAVVATFVVDSYKNIQPDSQGNTVVLLAQLVSHFAPDVHNNSISTAPIPPFVPDPSEVRVNVYWFLSLVVSLGTATAGITTLQWIREFTQYDRDLTSKQAFALRNLRAESFEKWHVHGTIATLPFLVQIALVLFLIGLCDFLFNSVARVVAIPSTIISGIIVVALILSMILPTMQHFALLGNFFKLRTPTPCPYKSQLGWLYFKVVYFLTTHILPLSRSLGGVISLVKCVCSTDKAKSQDKKRDWLKTLRELCEVYLYKPWRGPPNSVVYDTPWTSELEWLLRRDDASRGSGRSDLKTSMEDTPRDMLPVEYDAARGLAFMVDRSFRGRSTPYALYNCFHNLPARVKESSFFERMYDAKVFSKTTVQAVYEKPDEKVVQAEKTMFFLNSFEQTRLTSLKHRFADPQLELCIRVLGGIFTASHDMPPIREDIVARRSLDQGAPDLWLPRILLNSGGNQGLRQLSNLDNGDIYRQQLLLAFETFVSTSKRLQPFEQINTFHTFQQIVPFTETVAGVLQGLLSRAEDDLKDPLQDVDGARKITQRRQRRHVVVETTGVSINNHFIEFLQMEGPKLDSEPPPQPFETTTLFLASAVYIASLLESFKKISSEPWYTPVSVNEDGTDVLDPTRPQPDLERLRNALEASTPKFASSFKQLLVAWVKKAQAAGEMSVFGEARWFQKKRMDIENLCRITGGVDPSDLGVFILRHTHRGRVDGANSSPQPSDRGREVEEGETRLRESMDNRDIEKGLTPGTLDTDAWL